MKVSFETKAWITAYNDVTPDQLLTPKGAATLFYSINDMSGSGWTFVGTASVTVDIPEVRELVENKVAALRNQASAIRAEATAKCTEIDSQIQNLLAIEYTPAATAE